MAQAGNAFTQSGANRCFADNLVRTDAWPTLCAHAHLHSSLSPHGLAHWAVFHDALTRASHLSEHEERDNRLCEAPLQIHTWICFQGLVAPSLHGHNMKNTR